MVGDVNRVTARQRRGAQVGVEAEGRGKGDIIKDINGAKEAEAGPQARKMWSSK